MTRTTTIFAALVALAACAARPPAVRPAPIASAPPDASTSAPDRKLLEELSMMVVGAPPQESEVVAMSAKIGRGEASIETYVASLLADPRFATDVAPEIVLNKKAVDISEEVGWQTLRSITTGAGQKIFYLRRPCDAAAAVRVHPWWAPATEVLVCADAYQPHHLRDPKSGWYCGGDNLGAARSSFCGCGPSLMNCARDEEASAELRSGLRMETRQTVAHLVAHDEPLAAIFTTNSTVRRRESELFYRRWRVARGELATLPDLSSWPEEGRLAPRLESQPGQHAGVLTTPHILLFGDTPRARMRNFYDLVWCEPPASQRVSTAQILSLGVTDLRDGAGWKQLAAMPVCTSCHARLDYGMQFFAGYPSSFVGLVFAEHARGRGPLYAKDIGDARGEGELTPRAFAELATKQPEFLRCMARDVAEHVFGNDVAPEDTRAIEAALAQRATLKSALFDALVRYARRATATAHAIEWPSAREGAIDETGRIVPSGPLRALLAKECGACHRDGDEAFLREPSFDRALVLAMLEQVAFRAMPKTGMRATERHHLVRALIAALWRDDEQRAATRWFDGMRALGVERESAMLRLVERRAEGRDEDASSWPLLEGDRHDVAQLGTSVALSLALAALRDCKAAGRKGAALDECIARSADVAAQTKSR